MIAPPPQMYTVPNQGTFDGRQPHAPWAPPPQQTGYQPAPPLQLPSSQHSTSPLTPEKPMYQQEGIMVKLFRGCCCVV